MTTRGHHGLLLSSLAPPPPALAVASITQDILPSDSTTHNIPMPASVSAGDTLIVLLTVRASSGSVTITTPSGWSSIVSGPAGASSNVISAYYKIAAGTEGGTTVNFSSSVAGHHAAQTWRITGAINTPVAQEATASAATIVPLPSNNSGKSGSIIWIGGFGSNGTAAPLAWPTTYTDNQNTTASGGTNVCRMNASSKINTTGNESSPGGFTMGSSTNYRSFTIAVN